MSQHPDDAIDGPLFSALLWRQWVYRHCLNLIKLREETDDSLGRQTIKDIEHKTEKSWEERDTWENTAEIVPPSCHRFKKQGSEKHNVKQNI